MYFLCTDIDHLHKHHSYCNDKDMFALIDNTERSLWDMSKFLQVLGELLLFDLALCKRAHNYQQEHKQSFLL